MVICHIWSQGLSIHWKTLDQSADSSAVLIQFTVSFIFSSVCSSRHFFIRPSVRRPLVRSCVFVRLLARLIVRSFACLFFFFVKCFARPFSPIVNSCLWSSSIPVKFFFFYLNRHLFPWSSINELCFFPLPTNHEATHDDHSAAKIN